MAATTKKRTPYRLNIGATGVVYIKAVKNAVKDIATELGYTEDTDGVPPDGKVLAGEGREEALKAGCFPLSLYYKKGQNTQRAVVLVSPEKADTAAKELLGKKYNGYAISKVRPVARRKIVIG
ncbi:hypothetical protein A0J48_006995 [Sphaerospermopsis aphanizomenoides BCCUSP55]|uniref:hypothetical protein n=1 Tax=Sphaerospermopsis aphanizomenoides TaxID=459663 RepID=UPI001903DEA2|nr:hypothetical protein [Sphaerospermopsis aphanizomenoides]MBK1987283.1 hypothetical protein [Sphaerospermopsis aphanizomenoides BCCUSP55]